MDELRQELQEAIDQYDAAAAAFAVADTLMDEQARAPGGPTVTQMEAWRDACQLLTKKGEELRDRATDLMQRSL